MRALILVDIQNDFVSGSLAVINGGEVVPVANQLIGKFGLVVATQDWHPADHKSFASQNEGVNVGQQFDLNGLPQTAWPDHCIEDSAGAEFVEQLDAAARENVFRKGTNPEIDSYSGFFDNDHRSATGLGEFLKSKSVTEVFVMGLATDYCVKFTALDAIGLGLKTNLVIDGCRGVELSDGDIKTAVQEMKDAGVTIVRSNEIETEESAV